MLLSMTSKGEEHVRIAKVLILSQATKKMADLLVGNNMEKQYPLLQIAAFKVVFL